MFNDGRKNSRTLDRIGKEEYGFDFYSENIVYKDLCCSRLTFKERRKRKTLPVFRSYKDWSNYIIHKYADLDQEQLKEFSRYLNQQIRNRECSQNYWNLVIPVILTIVITEFFSMLIQTLNGLDIRNGYIVGLIVILMILVGSEIIIIILLIWNTLEPIWTSSLEKNFVYDFKEIIDGIIDRDHNK